MLWGVFCHHVKEDTNSGTVELDLDSLVKLSAGDNVKNPNLRALIAGFFPTDLCVPIFTRKEARTSPAPPDVIELGNLCFNSKCAMHQAEAAKKKRDPWLSCPKCKKVVFCSKQCRVQTIALHTETCTKFPFSMASIYHRMLKAADEKFGAITLDGPPEMLRWPIPIPLSSILTPQEELGLVHRTILYAKTRPEWEEVMQMDTTAKYRCFVCGRPEDREKMIYGGQIFGVTRDHRVVGWTAIACSPACSEQVRPGNPFVPHICFEASLTPIPPGGYAACLGARFDQGMVGMAIFSERTRRAETMGKMFSAAAAAQEGDDKST